MKQYLNTLLISTLITFGISCKQSSEKEQKISKDAPEISFDKLEHDYGTIDFESNSDIEFVFTNKGKEPLVLSNVRSSCGCTIPEWPKEPLKKGESAAIKVKYDTKRIGAFTKSITVYSNAKNSPVVLKIKGKVLDLSQKEPEAAAAE